MAEESILDPNMQREIDQNEFVKISKKTADSIREASPRGNDQDHLLKESIVKGEISFREALKVIRDAKLLRYDNPDDDLIGNDAVSDSLRLFMADRGRWIIDPHTLPNHEAHYIINIGVLYPGLRLPMVIAGVRQILADVDKYGYSKEKDGARLKQEKVARLSEYLYALNDLQTDLITDEIVRSTHEDWKMVRKRVVGWHGMSQELKKLAEKNVRLRSLLERPTIQREYKTSKNTKINVTASPIDPMFKNPGVKEQAKRDTY